jgi:phage gpG-like protein
LSDDAIASYNVKGLEKLLKALKEKPPVARIGILDGSTHVPKKPTKGSASNAEIGAAHEFGTSRGIPRRSFLRAPIAANLDKEMERSGLLDKNVLKEVIKQGSVRPWLEKVKDCAVACSLESFNTGGGGEWPAWKDPNYTNNGNQLLVDTHQLRDAVTGDVT